MAVFEIPVDPADAFQEFETDLDGVTFRIRLKFNDRDSAWSLTILDINNNILRAGLRVVTDWDLFRIWKSTPKPEGTMITTGVAGKSDPAQLNELGEDVILTYVGDT